MKPGLYCFDMDGTLISGYLGNPDKDYHKWEVLPGRIEKLIAIRDAGGTAAIVTNQGGVAFGYNTQDDFTKKIQSVLGALSVEGKCLIRHVSFCFAHPDGNPPYSDPHDVARRKPSGEMINEAINATPLELLGYICMVGDRTEDEGAAKAAGVEFFWEKDFFGGGN